MKKTDLSSSVQLSW